MQETRYELKAKSFGDRIRDQVARLWRSTPVFGLGAHIGYREDRLQQARVDDAGYRELMALMDAQPSYPHLSEERERHVMAGELAGFALATLVGLALFVVTRSLRTSWFVAWGLAFLADLVGGAVGGWLCDRKNPDPDEASAD